MYGKSTGNQRIESFWAILRRQCAEFWIDLFKTMTFFGILDTSDPVQIGCLRFCFMELIVKDLNRMILEWNTHRIQPRKGGGVTGIPDMMYFTPEAFETESFHTDVSETDLMTVETELMLDEGEPSMCSSSFVEVVNTLVPGWEPPEDVRAAQDRYVKILAKINTLDQE